MTTCQDILSIGDDYGDNAYACTFRCTLEAGHSGPHRNVFEHEGQSVVVAWHTSEDTILVADNEYLLFACEAEAPVSSVV